MERLVGIIVALMVHAAAFGLLALSFNQGLKPLPQSIAPKAPPVVEAVAVDEEQVQAQLERIRADESVREQALEQARTARIEEEKRISELKAKRAEEERLQEERLTRMREEQQRLESERAAIEKRNAEERQRLADLEKRNKAEADRQRKAEDQRKKAEADAKRADDEAKRAAREQALRASLAAEEQRLNQEEKERLNRLRGIYKADIENKVQRNWLKPVGSPDNFSCTVRVNQMPGGEVMSVQIVKSCGSEPLDRSVENAVRKASPLPAPPDKEVFDREINFIFKP